MIVLLFLMSFLHFFQLGAEDQVEVGVAPDLEISAQENGALLKEEPVDDLLSYKKVKKGYLPFSFEKKNLVPIINEIAAKKGVNIILPQNAADLETLKNQMITYRPQGKMDIPIEEAWHLLQTFLELSGFSLSIKKKDLYAIEKIGKTTEAGINRSLLPIFADVPPDALPNSQQRIRYIYYLKNLRVPTEQEMGSNQIARILRDTLSPDAPVVYEPKTNAIIITDKANTIASAMRIIKEFDHSGYKENVEVIHLNNTQASNVVKILESFRSAAGSSGFGHFIRSDSRADSVNYFSEDTKIIADPRLNNLILMGRQSAVERIADFIRNKMDLPPESGKSILHSYDLQYLDAARFAQVLSRIVAPLPAAGEQATVEGHGGPERYFKGVVVSAEEVKKVDLTTTTEEITLEASGGFLPTGLGDQQKLIGGNRLIIAALEDDWLRLKSLIEMVDKPQPYVILEVLILDIRGTKQKLISGTIRSKTGSQVPTKGFQFLSSNISDVNTVLGNRPEQLQQDLLQFLTGDTESGTRSLASLLAPGSLIISINDPKTPGIFGLLQVLETELNSKILSHPYLVTTNGEKATLVSQQLRRRQGNAIPGAAGVITVEIVDLPATLQVQMIPRISSLNRLSLQVAVDINDFIDITSDTRTTRRVNTNANMESGQVLVIGGLTRTDQTDVTTGTPILSQIPIIGSLFSRKSKITIKTNTAIFVCPTIVHPRLRGGLDVYTADKIRKSRRDVDDSLIFGESQDPITRLFFQTKQPTDALMRDYLTGTKNQPDEELIRTSKEKRREERKPSSRPKKMPPQQPQPGPVGTLAA